MPQGQPERNDRVVNMVAQQDREGFGGCTNIGECSAAVPQGHLDGDHLAAQPRPARRAPGRGAPQELSVSSAIMER